MNRIIRVEDDPLLRVVMLSMKQAHFRGWLWALGVFGCLWLDPSLAGAVDLAEGDPSKVLVSGKAVPELSHFDTLFRQFMAKYRVPGASFALARNGRLIYARGFGVADLASGRPVLPDSLFRIASISKSLTAMEVMRLVEAGRLKLETPILEILGNTYGAPADPRWKRITIRQLLQHTAGWDRDATFDPMFHSIEIARELETDPPATPAMIIRSMLRKPLDFNPGERYAYSNFGYCLLGRVIERITGTSYEEAVDRGVLLPLKIDSRNFRLGKSLIEDRASGEVTYYAGPFPKEGAVVGRPLGRKVDLPYGAWPHESLDAHGGWIATAPALVQLALALDNPSPIFKPETIKECFARPAGYAGFKKNRSPRESYYVLGWNVRPIPNADPKGDRRTATSWHTGSLPGTFGILVRRSDGFTWALLFNTRVGPKKEALGTLIDPLIHEAVDALRK